MKQADTAYITVGKIGSTYGVKGWLKIHTYTEFSASILQYKPWYISNPNGSWTEIDVEDGRPHGKTIVIKFAEINTPEGARLLTNRMIAIKREQLPKLSQKEYYWSDLEGLAVIDQHGTMLGHVAYLMETGSNDVIVIKDDKEKEHAIPYLSGDVILNIDLEKREIHVNWELF
ncbi:MAG: ribosome maturation factor RimM [Gammaproteobacteria bacterium]